MAANTDSKVAVYAALAGNLLVACTKIAAAVWTGSSAMMSEAIHSVVDTSNELVLLYGFHRASRSPDPRHPLGYGRELYFWSFIVALLLFALGAGVSLYEGVAHLMQPEPIENPAVSYVVLGLSFIFEAGSWWVALKRFRAAAPELSYIEAFRRSKDPPAFMVVFEDSAALIGIIIAAAATAAAVTFDEPAWDGVGSILIGLVLAATSMVLARESKSLLIGEPADPELARSVLEIARASAGVRAANGLLTVQLSPQQVVVALSIEFADELRADDIERAVVAIETELRARHPVIATLFVKPQTANRYREMSAPQLQGGPAPA
ncbi:putative Cation-efflux pump [Bradyrhizobium sp. ORS 285]|uniref:cation diffusion facilitator family transporter n=1 Tax=Bradyrhizobium sp. ORS 285 TaxID=115808 RepID=UPI00024094FB|nr:cation diffusion facilitator family transporter [Bradyrhizobium sp. ORS 285]CCD87496.1 putative Cation-efflux pump [Bradyrhizobium sp. ORS 285]SMX60351.1 putative Cation-efflux pump [Bradyrhizobium sp. ORS 285]